MLNSLRDACRRFSVDSDRVFISGHSMGGDAAWDLGTAHPDLWAGMIPIAHATTTMGNPAAALNAWDPSTFYTPGPKGYTDYPTLE